MCDVDLLSLEGKGDGLCLCVSERWMEHLEERILDADGQPRKVGG